MSPEERPTEPSPEATPRRRGESGQRLFELDFFARILERDPCYADVLCVHAANLAALGHHGRALQADRRLVRLLPDRPIPWYNLACSYAVLGMVEPAFAALGRALDLGYNHFDHLSRDPDLKSLRRDPRFIRLIRKAMSSGR